MKPAGEKNTVVVIRSRTMGSGSEELGTALMKGFIYALTQQDQPAQDHPVLQRRRVYHL